MRFRTAQTSMYMGLPIGRGPASSQRGKDGGRAARTTTTSGALADRHTTLGHKSKRQKGCKPVLLQASLVAPTCVVSHQPTMSVDVFSCQLGNSVVLKPPVPEDAARSLRGQIRGPVDCNHGRRVFQGREVAAGERQAGWTRECQSSWC